MIEKNNSTEGLIAALSAKGACEESLVFLEQCRIDGLTVEEAIVRSESEDGGEAWASWARTMIWDELSPQVKLQFSELATRNNARLAAHLDLHGEGLTKEEEELMQARWSDDMFPNIARQLKNGAVRRRARGWRVPPTLP
jgi:hypothetical protein